MQNLADCATAKIKVNPTEVRDMLGHPAHGFMVFETTARRLTELGKCHDEWDDDDVVSVLTPRQPRDAKDDLGGFSLKPLAPLLGSY